MTTREQLIKALRAHARIDSLFGDDVRKHLSEKAADMLEADGVPVASIYITPGGDREFDDWKCELPVGRNELYTAPQPAIQERKPLTDENALNCLDDAGINMRSDVTCEYELRIFRAAEAAHGIKEGGGV